MQTVWSAMSELTWMDAAVGFGVVAGTLVANLILVGVVVLMLPPTYLRDDHASQYAGGGGVLAHVVRKIGLNLLGLVLVAIGIVTSLPGVPGQGVLTIVIGIALMDVPGKRRLVHSVLGRENVLRRVNAFRRRFGMAPLVL